MMLLFQFSNGENATNGNIEESTETAPDNYVPISTLDDDKDNSVTTSNFDDENANCAGKFVKVLFVIGPCLISPLCFSINNRSNPHSMCDSLN